MNAKIINKGAILRIAPFQNEINAIRLPLNLLDQRCAAIDLTVRVKVALTEIDSAEPSSAVEVIFVLVADDLEAGRITLLCNID